MQLTKLALAAALGGAIALVALPGAAQQTPDGGAQMRGDGPMRHAARHDRGHDGARGDRGGARIMGMIETFDLDGDGAITQEEIDGLRLERLQAFDADGDGALDLEEYQALWLDAMRERMVDRFQAHDDDGDGLVTVEEFSKDYEGMVARRDRNGDDRLDAADLRRGQGRGAAPESE